LSNKDLNDRAIRLFREKQQGKRAEYGKQLINFLAVQLEPEFGSGYGQR
jgi:hypothetical protein